MDMDMVMVKALVVVVVNTWSLMVVQATKNSPTVESGFFGMY